MTVTPASRHLTASMVVFDGPHVLLVRHNATGKWLFPGGHVDDGETPAEAALREVQEETRLAAVIHGLPGSWMKLPGMRWHPSPWMTAEAPAPAKAARPGKPAEPAHRHIDMLFIGTADSSLRLATPADEVSGARWVPLASLDLLNTRPEVPAVAREAYAVLVFGPKVKEQ